MSEFLSNFQPSDIWIVLSLVILEGLLSCDNAVVLAIMTRPLPPEQRGKALRYGIWGAYVFRALALALATVMIKLWYVKVIGGLYLVWLAVQELRKKIAAAGAGHDVQPEARIRLIPGLNAFWSTVVFVELTDIVFSVDSITAAVALSSKYWVLLLGGIIGILVMRYMAQMFVRLLEAFPLLESAAYVAVFFIGLKLVLEIPRGVLGLPEAHPGQSLLHIEGWMMSMVVLAIFGIGFMRRAPAEVRAAAHRGEEDSPDVAPDDAPSRTTGLPEHRLDEAARGEPPRGGR